MTDITITNNDYDESNDVLMLDIEHPAAKMTMTLDFSTPHYTAKCSETVAERVNDIDEFMTDMLFAVLNDFNARYMQLDPSCSPVYVYAEPVTITV